MPRRRCKCVRLRLRMMGTWQCRYRHDNSHGSFLGIGIQQKAACDLLKIAAACKIGNVRGVRHVIVMNLYVHAKRIGCAVLGVLYC